MTDYARLDTLLADALHLTRRPVAITFRDTPPVGIEQFTGTEPSGCSFWRLAAGGRTFYTVPADHYNCPVGSHTHNMPLPQDREAELTQMLTLMSDIGYIRLEEVPAVPRLATSPAVAIYAPLGDTPVDPDVVLVAAQPGQLMLLHEAVTRAGKPMLPLLGRPTCMAVPAAISGGAASSLGCVGNRIYTDLPDHEFYTVMAGSDLPAIVDQLGTITSANTTLADFHHGRRAALATE